MFLGIRPKFKFAPVLFFLGLAFGVQGAPVGPKSEIAARLKPEVLKRILEDREVMSNADLQAADKNGVRKYEFYVAMMPRAGFSLTRKTLTHYEVYQKLIPFIQETQWDASKWLLKIRAGAAGFYLRSTLHFKEEGQERIRYEIVDGSFRGLRGDILFESRGEKGTLVYMDGHLAGKKWPPTTVMEVVANMVLTFTGRKMSSHIESEKTKYLVSPPGGSRPRKDSQSDVPNVPQPRSRLRTH